MWHRHRMPPYQQVSLSNFFPARVAPVNISPVIVKRKCLGATTAQSRSGRPHKLRERDQRVLKRTAHKNCLSSVATLTTKFQTASGSKSVQELLVGNFMKWVSMAEQPHTSLRSPCAMPSVGWSGVKLTAIGLWSSGNAFSGVMNHTSPSGGSTDKSGFGGCQENATCHNV